MSVQQGSGTVTRAVSVGKDLCFSPLNSPPRLLPRMLLQGAPHREKASTPKGEFYQTALLRENQRIRAISKTKLEVIQSILFSTWSG